jgi:MoaA/NifB/PqqE/SkfB family radical SAM enzyme
MASWPEFDAFPRLSAPVHVDFEITGRCQLRCDYCSAMPLGSPDADSATTLDFLRELQELGVFSLLISGGEPTLHRDFLQILQRAAACVPSVTVNSNGLRLADRKFCEAVKDAAPNALLAISVDAIDPAINDVHRGAGGAKALAAIDNCVDLGMKVCVSSVLTEASLPQSAELVVKLWPRVRQFRFFPQVPRSPTDLAGRSADYQQKVSAFFEELGQLAADRPGIHLLTPFGNVADDADSRREAACVCLLTRVYVDSHFNVFPCFYAAAQANLLGSLRRQSLRTVWQSGAARDLRSQKNPCQSSRHVIPLRYIGA